MSGLVQSELEDYTTGAVTRISGADRYATAAEVSGTFSGSTPVVYLAQGDNFPDALAGAARAGMRSAPVLLTNTGGLPSGTRAALDDLNPQRIVILGGEGSVSRSVQNQVKGYASSGVVERVGASSRWGTSADLGLFYPPTADVVYVANGNSFPDALAAGAAAGDDGAPVLLTQRGAVPWETREALAALHPREIVVIGGTASVSSSTREELRGFISTDAD